MTTTPKPSARWYDDACGAAHGLELLGERWALLVVRELMFGPRRFGELRSALPGISANVLTQRLEGLEDSGIVVRRALPGSSRSQAYELTPWGYEAEPILHVLGRWAARSPEHDPSLPLSAASLLLSFRTMISAKRVKDAEATVGLRLDGDDFVARVHDGGITIRRGDSRDAEAALTGRAVALAAVVYGGRALADAEDDGELAIAGNRALARRFVTWFVLPPKAG